MSKNEFLNKKRKKDGNENINKEGKKKLMKKKIKIIKIKKK